jgi:arsenate reductase
MADRIKNVLVLCTGNSCRSQMAEGYLRFLAGPKAKIYSAGLEPHGLNPDAVATMKADGIDISGHTSNHVDEYRNVEFDFVITVCDHANETCPYFPSGAVKLHHNFSDPSKYAGTEEERKNEFERVRKLIRAYCGYFVHQYL